MRGRSAPDQELCASCTRPVRVRRQDGVRETTSNSSSAAPVETGGRGASASLTCRRGLGVAVLERLPAPPVLESLLGFPPGEHEVALLARSRPQQHELLESGLLVDHPGTSGEPLLELEPAPGGTSMALILTTDMSTACHAARRGRSRPTPFQPPCRRTAGGAENSKGSRQVACRSISFEEDREDSSDPTGALKGASWVNLVITLRSCIDVTPVSAASRTSRRGLRSRVWR